MRSLLNATLPPRLRVAVCFVTLAAALVGCGDTSASRPAAVASPSRPGVPPPSDVPSPQTEVLDYASLTINQLVNGAQVGVLALVTDVGPLRWNSASGRPWQPGPQDPLGFPLTMRDVRVQVETVVFSDGSPSTVGNELTLRQQGPASIAAKADDVNQRYNLAASSFAAVGDRLLLLLAEHPLPQQSGDLLPGLEPVNGYQSAWRVEGSTAVSADPERTAPLADLLTRLRQERARGPQPAEPGDLTGVNPLASPIPPPPPPPPPPPVPFIGNGCGR